MRTAHHCPRHLAALAAAALLACASATRAEAPELTNAPTVATADAAYSTLDLDWLDAARSRPVPARLYLPAGASAAHPVPLIVFSHGIGGSRRGYSYLGQYWASQGFASLHLQHVGSDRNLWTGNPLTLVSRLQGAAQDTEALARVADLRFALDEVLRGEFAPRLDAQRIVAAGHSYGANTALLAVGARVERQGQPLDLRDPRLKAALLLSAPPFYGETDVTRILGGISVPTLHVTATDDVIRIPGYYSGAADRIAVFDAIGSTRKALAVFSGGSHSMFTDRSGTGGAALNPQVKAATKELSAAFVRSVFGGGDAALREWPQRHGGIVARFVPAGS
jgi:predicted dienelactone hydrolase